MESLSIGCVTYSDRYLTKNEGEIAVDINDKLINEVYYATCLELELITRRYRRQGWDIAVGSSGTMRAIASLMPEDIVAGVITRDGLNNLVDRLRQHGNLAELDGELSTQRASVMPAGIVILSAIFDQLQLDEVHVVNSTLKEGLVYDILGRLSAQDMRDQTVEKMMERYQIDQEQALRVDKTMQHLMKNLPAPIVNGVDISKILHWAALLHEIGLSVSHSGYHHHGAYLLKHSDMAGFSHFEQELLSLFVGSHRRKIRSERLQLLTADTQQSLGVFFVCLRIAVLLNHRREDDIDLPRISVKEESILLAFVDGWLDEHPLSYRKLLQEQRYLEPLSIQFEFL